MTDYEKLLTEIARMTDPVAKRICFVLGSLGSLCYCHKIEEGSQSNRYYLTPAPGVTFASIADKSKDLLIGVGFDEEPVITAVSGAILIEGTVSKAQKG